MSTENKQHLLRDSLKWKSFSLMGEGRKRAQRTQQHCLFVIRRTFSRLNLMFLIGNCYNFCNVILRGQKIKPTSLKSLLSLIFLICSDKNELWQLEL